MTLIQTIKNDQLTARKAKDKLQATLLTTLLGDASMPGKNDGNRESTDAEVIKVIKKFINGIDEMIKHGGDTVTLDAEKLILETYMPAQMSDEEIKIAVSGFMVDLNAITMKDMGKVMGAMNKAHAGTFDGGVASKYVRDRLV